MLSLASYALLIAYEVQSIEEILSYITRCHSIQSDGRIPFSCTVKFHLILMAHFPEINGSQVDASAIYHFNNRQLKMLSNHLDGEGGE